MLNPPIIFEDNSMIVINKPAGVVVNRADTTGKVETVQDWVENRMGNVQSSMGNEEFVSRGGIVHRLDKDTSGVLIIAKTPEAFENLKNQFKDRKTVKKYLALVHGEVKPPVGTIDAPIERSPFNRMHFGVFPGGREAQTHYKLIRLVVGANRDSPARAGHDRPLQFSLMEVTPLTGRTHQIRVHMKHLGHPVVSDPIYGGRKQIRADLKWCPRLFLHAESLELMHPVTGKKLIFEAELSKELNTVLNTLLNTHSNT